MSWSPYNTPAMAGAKRRDQEERARGRRRRAYQSESEKYVRVLGKRRDES